MEQDPPAEAEAAGRRQRRRADELVLQQLLLAGVTAAAARGSTFEMPSKPCCVPERRERERPTAGLFWLQGRDSRTERKGSSQDTTTVQSTRRPQEGRGRNEQLQPGARDSSALRAPEQHRTARARYPEEGGQRLERLSKLHRKGGGPNLTPKKCTALGGQPYPHAGANHPRRAGVQQQDEDRGQPRVFTIPRAVASSNWSTWKWEYVSGARRPAVSSSQSSGVLSIIKER